MIPGIATKRIHETIGDDWVWSLRFVSTTGLALDISEATITAAIEIGASRREVAVAVGDAAAGEASISIDESVTALYGPTSLARLVIRATVDGDVRTVAIVGLILIDPASVAIPVRSTSDEVPVSSSRPVITITTDPFGEDITAPTITTPATANVVENSTLSIVLTASEAVNWSISGGIDQALFELNGATLRWAGNGVKNFEAPNDSNGDNAYVIQVTATDGAGNATNKTITVTVLNINEVPAVLNPISDQSATADAPFSFQFGINVFGDVDAGDTLTYTATLDDNSPLPAWLTFTPATRTFSGTPTSGDIGTLSIKVTATDSGALSVFDSFDLVVFEAGDALARIASVDVALPWRSSYPIPDGTISAIDRAIAGRMYSIAGGAALIVWSGHLVATQIL